METLASLPFVRLSVDKAGALAAGTSFGLPADITDLIVISHGWKNSEQDALELYATLLANVRDVAGARFADGGRRWGVAGIFWPAFRFRPDLTLLPDDGTAAIPGDAAAAIGGEDLPRDELSAYAATIAAGLGEDEVAFARAAVAASAGGVDANTFTSRLRAQLSPAPDLKDEHASLLEKPGAELVDVLSTGAAGTPLSFHSTATDSDVGNAAGFKEIVAHFQRARAGRRAAVATLLNQATYYEMKARAGAVGKALAPLVDRAAAGARVHLIGHSFGARLVSALANALETVRPASLSLLQGAFSHNGFGSASVRREGAARVDGVFREVVAGGRVAGPMLVTHTRNDTAVGLFYAIASTVSQDVAAGFNDIAQKVIGGPDDRHGGLGANGALSLLDGEAEDHVAVPALATPVLAPGKVHNVLADAIITEHNDVANREVARLVWAAIA